MDRVLFFHHIPKTAGTTLNGILEANFPQEAVLSAYDHAGSQRLNSLDAHEFARLRLIQGHVFIHDFEAFFANPILAFTMLREPVARVVSEFDFLKNWPEHHLYTYLRSHDVSLEEYVTSTEKALAYRGRNLMCSSLCGTSPMPGSDAEMLARAKANLDRFHVVGVTELFDASLLLLQEAAGLQNVLYDRRNVRSAPHRLREITPREREVIEEANKLDQELYCYARTLVEAAIARRGAGFQARLRAFRKINAHFQQKSEEILRRSGVRQEAKSWVPDTASHRL